MSMSLDITDVDALLSKAQNMQHTQPQQALNLATQALNHARSLDYSAGEAHSLQAAAECHYHLADYEEATRLANQSLALFRTRADLHGETQILRRLGAICLRQSLYPDGLDYLSHSLTLAQQHKYPVDEGLALQGLGSLYSDLGDYDRALDFTLNAHRIFQNHGELRHMTSSLSDAGVIYDLIGNYEDAAQTWQECLRLCREHGYPRIESQVLTNLGLLYHNLTQPQNAVEHTLKAMDLMDAHQDRLGKTITLINLGLFYPDLDRLAEAEQVLTKALALLEVLNYPWLKAEALLAFGNLCLARSELDDAVNYFEQAVEIAMNIQVKSVVVECLQQLAEVYKLKGDLAAALAHLEAFHKAERELFNERSNARINGLRISYEVDKARQEKEIYRLKHLQLKKAYSELQTLHLSLQTANKRTNQLLDRLAVQARLLEEQSKHDGLTGLTNRRTLEDILAEAFDEAHRYGVPLTVALCDVDDFKQINDQFLHRTGDDVLRALATIFRKHLGPDDAVARYGGEEFAWVMPSVTLSGAQQKCERIRRAVEEYAWETINPDIAVTISVGICSDKTVDHPEKMLVLADAKLYEAKGCGKNQVCW